MSDDDEWEGADDLVRLHTAADVDEFRRRLVLYPPGPTNRSDAFEPWCLFRHFHNDEPDGAATTAVLIVTDRRWSNASGRLIHQIEAGGLIAAGDLDVLAETFVTAGPQVYWELPGEWFDGPEITIDLWPAQLEDEPGEQPGEPDDDGAADGPVVAARVVRPPLRRWAAARILRSNPGMWGKLVERARQSDPRAGAAIMRGILDAVDNLTPAARAKVIDLASTWPQHDVREAASAIGAGQQPGPRDVPGRTSSIAPPS